MTDSPRYKLDFTVGRDTYRAVFVAENRFDATYYRTVIERKSTDAMGDVRWICARQIGWNRKYTCPECETDNLHAALIAALFMNLFELDLNGIALAEKDAEA